MLLHTLKENKMIRQPKLKKPEQKRRKDLAILATILKSLKKLKMPTIKLFKKLKKLCGRNFCRARIEKTFFRKRIDVELR